MFILAIDTSSITASVALLEDGVIKGEYNLNTGLTHSEQLLPMVEALLKNTGSQIEQIDRFVVTSGPGSFTGLRIGIATANALAQAHHKEVLGLSTLDALAENGRHFKGYVCPILNARRGEVYTALYESDGRELKRLSEHQAIALHDFMKQIPDDQRQIYFVGDGVLAYAGMIEDFFGDRVILASEGHRFLAAGRLGQLALNHSEDFKILPVEPVYLRESEAVIRWREAHPGEAIDGL